MLDQKKVFDILKGNGVSYFTGVPDSYLNGFCNFALANCGERNVIAANEGNAVGIAAGHYFASREIPLVYMQNSGIHWFHLWIWMCTQFRCCCLSVGADKGIQNPTIPNISGKARLHQDC